MKPLNASLDLGASHITLTCSGYTHPEVEGADADWLSMTVEISAPGVSVSIPALVLAGEVVAWMEVLDGIHKHPGRARLANIENDFELTCDTSASGIVSFTCVLPDNGTAAFNFHETPRVDAVKNMHTGLQEIAWAYPRRSAQPHRDV